MTWPSVSRKLNRPVTPAARSASAVSASASRQRRAPGGAGAGPAPTSAPSRPGPPARAARRRAASRPAPAVDSGHPSTAPLWLNSQRPCRNGAAAAGPWLVPGVALRTAASSAPALVTPATSSEGLVRPDGHGLPVPDRLRVAGRVPAHPEPVRVYRPAPLVTRRPGLPVQAMRRVDDHRTQRGRQARGRPGACTSSGLRGRGTGGAEPGEDLPPDRVVPVPERAPAGHRADRERPAAEHLVLGTEEHLRVLPVGPGAKPRIRTEVRTRPLPDVPDQLPGPARRRPLRVRAGRRGPQELLAQVGVRGLRLRVAPRVTAGTGRSPGRTGPPSPTRPRSAAGAPPSGRTRRPRTSTRAARVLPAGPARSSPNTARTHCPPSRLQYSGADSPARCRCSQPAAVHQRGSSYPPSAMNSAYAPQVTGVVSRKNGATSTACAGRSLSSAQGSVEVPMVNGPPGTSTSDGSRSVSAGAGPGAGAVSTGAPARIWWVISIVSSCCDLVLGDHAEREPVAEQPRAAVLQAAEPGPLQQVEHPAAHLAAVGPRLRRRQQRQRRALGARVLERVVERVDLRVHGLAPADLAQQPEFFLVGDVRQVPDQRGHQRRVLSDQVGLVHAVGEQRRPLPRASQFPRDHLPQCVSAGSRHVTPSSWSLAGHRSCSTYRSVKSATACRIGAGAPARPSAASAASKHCLLARLICGSAGPDRAARSHGSWAPDRGSAARPTPARRRPARRRRRARRRPGPWPRPRARPSRRPGCASIIRSSRCPRGRTGGNSVDRW